MPFTKSSTQRSSLKTWHIGTNVYSQEANSDQKGYEKPVTKKVRKTLHRRLIDRLPTGSLNEFDHLIDYIDAQRQTKESLRTGLITFFRKSQIP